MGGRLSASFRDPSGSMYLQDGKLLRQVNNVYKEDYDYLLSSGLYETLIEKKIPDTTYRGE